MINYLQTVRVWKWQGENENYICQHIFKDRNDEVRTVSVHPTKKYLMTASLDNTYRFNDLSAGLCLTQVFYQLTLDEHTLAHI